MDQLTAPVLAIPVDLSRLLNLSAGRAWVGFTGATGAFFASQDILSWEFESF